MQFQLIQNFLDLPGIIGFSLVPLDDTADHAYSVGFPQGNGPDKNPLLRQGIQQIIKTTPSSLEFCAFQFASYQVELHKVESGAVLLIFSEGVLSSQYSKSVSELMQFIKADYLALVETIQSIQPIHAKHVTPATTFSVQRQTVSVDDVVAAMNSLSQVTSRYLGTQLVANHWRTNQSQDMVWLKKFCISVDGTISVKDLDAKLSPEQLAEIRLWTQRFHRRCTRIIRDYDVLVEQTLPKEHWQLLFGG